MARRFQPKSSPGENLGVFFRFFPWKLLLLVPALVLVAIPVFAFGSGFGGNVMPAVTQFFTQLSAPAPPPTPTPQPALPSILPQPGSLTYTVQGGDNCVSILAYEMHMDTAGTVFSDSKPETVRALNKTLGQDCNRLQPGMDLSLSPHYPLTALGGIVQKIESLTPEQLLPTPLIEVPEKDENGLPSADCSGGCRLLVRLNPETEVIFKVTTGLPVRVGSWIWAQAMLPRQAVDKFVTYPYVDPSTSLNGKELAVCSVQVDDEYDDQSPLCQQLQPNTILADGGSWMLAVTGPGSLDHWRYPLQFEKNTKLLLWLSLENGTLNYKQGNPLYRYNEETSLYEKV